MNLYWLEREKRYVHRLSDIPKGEPIDKHEIPTDLNGLMGVLNGLHEQIVMAQKNAETLFRVASEPADEASSGHGEDWGMPQSAPEPVIPEPVVAPKPMDAGSILSRMDNPGVDVEGVVEAIAKAKGHALGRYARSIATRFQELGKL